jgi:hypothetical protein
MTGAGLSYAARVALLSLRDQPDHDTSRQIAGAPLGLTQEDVATGLQELARLGLAVESGGHWQLLRDRSHP